MKRAGPISGPARLCFQLTIQGPAFGVPAFSGACCAPAGDSSRRQGRVSSQDSPHPARMAMAGMRN